MNTETTAREPIVASEGMIFTNGEIYASEIYLAEGMSSEKFYEISKEEYEAMRAAEVENEP